MNIPLSELYTLFSLSLPLIVAAVAGLVRQDRLPALVNELISHALVFVLAALDLALQGKLSLNYSSDLMLVIGYTTVLLNSPVLKPLQSYLQKNVLSFGSPVLPLPQNAPALEVDAVKLANLVLPELSKIAAPAIAQELVKYARVQATVKRPAVQTPVQNPQALPAVKPSDQVGG